MFNEMASVKVPRLRLSGVNLIQAGDSVVDMDMDLACFNRLLYSMASCQRIGANPRLGANPRPCYNLCPGANPRPGASPRPVTGI